MLIKSFLLVIGTIITMLFCGFTTPTTKAVSSRLNCGIKYRIENNSSYTIEQFNFYGNGQVYVHYNIGTSSVVESDFPGPTSGVGGGITITQPSGNVSVKLYITDLAGPGSWTLVACTQLSPTNYDEALLNGFANGGCDYRYLFVISDGNC